MIYTKNGLRLLVGEKWLDELVQRKNKETHGANRKSLESFTPSTPQSK